jgi:hypothetical protein
VTSGLVAATFERFGGTAEDGRAGITVGTVNAEPATSVPYRLSITEYFFCLVMLISLELLWLPPAV